MKALLIYDSEFGNTEQTAQAIGSALGKQEDVKVIRVSELSPDYLAGLTLLVVGSPTQRFRPTIAITGLLKGISKDSLKGVKVAAFDTRLTLREINQTPVLAFFVKLSGAGAYAAKSIADRLKKSGGELVAPPEGFFVDGTKGPLVQGELDRAAKWAAKFKTGLV